MPSLLIDERVVRIVWGCEGALVDEGTSRCKEDVKPSVHCLAELLGRRLCVPGHGRLALAPQARWA